MKKILVMGLPGSGKSYLSKLLAPMLKAVWLNADKVRKQANDWDFSIEGRLRQAKRMADLSDKIVAEGNNVVADFICPTEEARKIYSPDYIIFMNTITSGRYPYTNILFEQPNNIAPKLLMKVSYPHLEPRSMELLKRQTQYFLHLPNHY